MHNPNFEEIKSLLRKETFQSIKKLRLPNFELKKYMWKRIEKTFRRNRFTQY